MSCSRWCEYTIGESCDLLTGFPFKSKDYLKYGKYKVVRGDNVKTGFIYWEEKSRFWNEIDEKLEKYLLRKDDIVIGMDGSRVGKNRAIIREQDIPSILAQRVACVRAKGNMFDQIYLKNIIMSNLFEKYIDSIKTGTSIPHISLKQISDFRFMAPNIEEQKRIASVLSSLDEKIELNNEMNKTLEEMAQALFKRWFVDFEFPSVDGKPYKSSGGEMVTSEMGMIPKGWKVYSVTDLVDSISIKHKFDKEKVIFLNTSDVLDGEVLINNYTEVSELPGQAKKSIQKNDILYSEIRPKNKRYAFVDFEAEDYVVSTKLMVLRAKNILSPILIYQFLTSNDTVDYLQSIAESRSGTFPQITFKELEKLKIALPDQSILSQSNNTISALFYNIQENKRENKSLIELRDSLLPKLMSGEIKVNELKTNS